MIRTSSTQGSVCLSGKVSMIINKTWAHFIIIKTMHYLGLPAAMLNKDNDQAL